MQRWGMFLTMIIITSYCVVMVNYRGSFGYGEGNIHSLSGKIGTQDINDVLSTLQVIREKQELQEEPYQHLDMNCIYIQGISHGGFIGAHLIGQYPDMFKVWRSPLRLTLQCAYLRNPATNFVNMFGITDMSDWCLVESGCSITRGYSLDSTGQAINNPSLSEEDIQKAMDIQKNQYICTEEDLKRMYKVSPYQYASKVY